jgi:hypothetical protein
MVALRATLVPMCQELSKLLPADREARALASVRIRAMTSPSGTRIGSLLADIHCLH